MRSQFRDFLAVRKDGIAYAAMTLLFVTGFLAGGGFIGFVYDFGMRSQFRDFLAVRKDGIADAAMTLLLVTGFLTGSGLIRLVYNFGMVACGRYFFLRQNDGAASGAVRADSFAWRGAGGGDGGINHARMAGGGNGSLLNKRLLAQRTMGAVGQSAGSAGCRITRIYFWNAIFGAAYILRIRAIPHKPRQKTTKSLLL